MVRSPEVIEGEARFWADLSRCADVGENLWRETSGRVSLKLLPAAEGLEIPTLHEGDRLRFQASFRLPTDFKTPGSFRATRHYEAQGISALGTISDPRWVLVLPGENPRGFAAWMEKARNRLREAVSREAPGEAGGFLLSLLIGERGGLSKETLEAFQRSGVTHLIAISGLNVTVVAGIFLILFRLLAAFPVFSSSVWLLRLAPLGAILPVWLYVALARFPVSGVRAAWMATFFLSALSLWRRLDLLSSLLLAAFLILSFHPLALFGVSFQLSFLAVLFLILFYPRLRREVPRGQKRWLAAPGVWLWNSLVLSLVCLAGVAPVLFFHFHELSLTGLLANVVIVPLVDLILLPLSMAGWLLTGICGGNVPFLWQAAGFFSGLALKGVEWFSNHAEWGLFHGAVSFWQVLLYYGICFLFLLREKILGRRWRYAGAGCCMALLLWGGWMPSSGKLKVTFLDVGQGDGIVLQLPNGKVWVIDGGGIKGSDWDIGRFVVAPALWEAGIHRVDKLFLSHPHHDHYKGLGYLAQKFFPSVVYVNGDNAPENEAMEWEGFLERLSGGNVPSQTVTRATKPLEEAGVRVQFLMPSPEGTRSHFDVNDNSVVMRLTYGDVSFLLPGDLMELGELTLLEAAAKEGISLKSTVLKTGHHGSQTSTTPAFLEAVAPKYAVISVGEFNTYGLPDETVLDRLREKNVQIFRTDKQGAVTFETDGKSVVVSTFAP